MYWALNWIVSISASASLAGIPVAIVSSTIGIKICTVTAVIKKYEKHDKIVLLAKTKLNSIEILIYRTLIESYYSHNKNVIVNNVLKENDDLEKEIKVEKLNQSNKKF